MAFQTVNFKTDADRNLMQRLALKEIRWADISGMDRAIMDGNGNSVRSSLLKMEVNRLNGTELMDQIVPALVEICLRVNLPDLALRLVFPHLKANSNFQQIDEGLKYALGTSLIQIGDTRWGRRILQTVDTNLYPKSLLFLGISYFTEWNGQLAFHHLSQYVHSEKLKEYDRMIGNLNLASASFAIKNYDLTEHCLSSLIPWSKETNRFYLHGSCLEMQGQLLLQKKEFGPAKKCFTTALETIKSVDSLPYLWSEKWMAVAELMSGSKDFSQIQKIKEKSIRLKDYETLRECDLFIGHFSQDPQLIKRVYFGSSYRGYRSRISELVSKDLLEEALQDPVVPISPKFDIGYGKPAEKTPNDTLSDTLELFSGSFQNSHKNFEFASQNHQLVFACASDLYRPFSIAGIFSLLFSEEYYNPYVSPQRVHQAKSRLKRWALENKVDLSLDFQFGSYKLNSDSVSVKFEQPITIGETNDLILEKLKKTFPRGEFSAKEASLLFGLSARGTTRILKQYCDRGFLDKLGSARTISYLIKEQAEEKNELGNIAS